MTTQQSGLICAYLLDGKGGAKILSKEQLDKWQENDGPLWVHINYKDETMREWLTKEAGLSPIISNALIAEDSRPRCVVHKDGIFTTLRGVNLNPGADPEDMVSIRIWFQANRVITTRRRMLLSVTDLRDSLEQGRGPKSTAELLTDLTECLARRIADVCDDVDEKIENLAENVLMAQSYQLRTDLAELRRQVVSLRRYLAPQREALNRLSLEKTEGVTDLDRIRLREIADRICTYVEDLDSARDRASVTQEELMGKLTEQMEKRIYLLSIIAAIFLPISFLTGLLGINVAGIPLNDDPFGFMFVCIALSMVIAFELWIFRKLNWL